MTSQLTQYDEHEARSIVRLMLSDVYGLTFTDICAGALDRLDDAQRRQLDGMMRRLRAGEPVQYVTGKALFCGRTFHVRGGCLIPRPETEELCRWIVSEAAPAAHILDIGTGSGCIAVTLKSEIPRTAVTAWDLSARALGIARENAALHHADITFRQQDALSPPDDRGTFDVIVSNPPYICRREAQEMEGNVLEYEPHEALFVPDSDPLLFYRSIARYSARALRRDGMLYFEINPEYARDIRELLLSCGFTNVAVRQDEYGKERMARGRKGAQITE